VADDADERWGSCFYFLRPRVRTRLAIIHAQWYEKQLSVYGQLSLDTDQQVQLSDHLPLRVRVRLEHDDSNGAVAQWINVQVQPGGGFTIHRPDYGGPTGAALRIQAWFDRTDMLASSRSDVFTCEHTVAPVIK
jgi:hypothetical protein